MVINHSNISNKKLDMAQAVNRHKQMSLFLALILQLKFVSLSVFNVMEHRNKWQNIGCHLTALKCNVCSVT